MPVRAVIDTNIWVSSLLNPSGYPARLRDAFVQGLFEVIVSEPILEEIADVLSRPRIKDKYGITDSEYLSKSGIKPVSVANFIKIISSKS